MTATGHDLDRLGPVSAVDHLEPGDLLLGLGKRPVEDHYLLSARREDRLAIGRRPRTTTRASSTVADGTSASTSTHG